MLNADSLKRIDREIAKYPADRRQSAVMAALAIAQDEKGWLSTETMDFVASYLRMPSIAVYEVATFYERRIISRRRSASISARPQPTDRLR